jgi:hypothetical protein
MIIADSKVAFRRVNFQRSASDVSESGFRQHIEPRHGFIPLILTIVALTVNNTGLCLWFVR